MRLKILAFVCAMLLSSAMLKAQSVSVGAGPTYGSDIQTLGLNLRAYYNVGTTFCFGPEFSYFLPHVETHGDEEITRTLWEANVNIHYFLLREPVGLYPVVGLNYSYETESARPVEGSFGSVISGTYSKEAWGLNLGFGAHYPYERWIFFAEYKYLISDLAQHSATVGFFYTFGSMPEGGH